MRVLRWLEARYQRALVQFGYEYPPYYMLLTEVATLALAVEATVARIVEGPSGVQWVLLGAAAALSLTHLACGLVLVKHLSMAAYSAMLLASVALYWSVPASFDVVPLLATVGITSVAAVQTLKAALAHLVVYEAVVVIAGLVGAIHQPWLVALTVAFGACVGHLMQNQLLVLRAERMAQSDRIALDRATIAGEVHDVVAHSLAVVLLNVTAARRALESDDDRAEAVVALVDAETQGRSAMNDIRHTIELLRTDNHDGPQPGLSDVAELVESYRRAGLSVTVDVQSPTEQLGGSAELAAFRVVQESLSNAVKHAPGARVEVSIAPRADTGLVVEVSCPAPPGARRSPGGSGLAGMRSRVESVGGTLHVGPVDRRWLVNASFPRPVSGLGA